MTDSIMEQEKEIFINWDKKKLKQFKKKKTNRSVSGNCAPLKWYKIESIRLVSQFLKFINNVRMLITMTSTFNSCSL